MIVNQWVPAAHRGDAIGDSARRVRDLLRALGHQSDIFALTIDDDMRDEVRPFATRRARAGDVTIFHFALPSPMTAAFARAAARARAAVPQRHAGALLRALRARRLPDRRARPPRSRVAGRPRPTWRSAIPSTTGGSSRRWGSANTGVLPIAIDTARITERAAASRAREDPARRAHQLPLRRPHRAEQADRGHHPAGRAVTSATSTRTTGSSSSAGPTACRATTPPIRALIERYRDAAGPLPVHRARSATGSWRRTTARRASTSR